MRARAVRPDWRAVLVVAAGTLFLVGVVLEAPPWLRVPAAVVWTLVIPGLPWALRLRLGDPGDTAGVALAISLAATALVGGGMASLHAWSPLVAVLLLAAFALVGAFLPRLRRPGRPSRSSSPPAPEVPAP